MTRVLPLLLLGAVIGYLWCEREERPPTPFTHAQTRLYVHHLAVFEAWSGRGVGKRLLQDAEAYGRACGCDESVLSVWAANAHAREFYRRQGYAAGRLILGKALG